MINPRVHLLSLKSGAMVLAMLMGLALPLTTAHATGKSSYSSPQTRVAVGVAQLCEGLLLGFARNPSLRPQFEEIYNGVLEEMKKQKLDRSQEDFLEATGMISGALIQAYARNPSLLIQLEEIAQGCEADYRALFKMRAKHRD